MEIILKIVEPKSDHRTPGALRLISLTAPEEFIERLAALDIHPLFIQSPQVNNSSRFRLEGRKRWSHSTASFSYTDDLYMRLKLMIE